MKIFKKLVALFTRSNVDTNNDVYVLKNPLKSKKDADVSTVIKTQPVSIRAKIKLVPGISSTKLETRASLNKMSKIQIDDLARENFGVDLDRRERKVLMIGTFLKEQKKDNT